MDTAILCHVCHGNGDYDRMWPGSGHDDDATFGVAEVEPLDDGEWLVRWMAAGLTVAEASAFLDQMELAAVRMMS